jgi:hypothetical protein
MAQAGIPMLPIGFSNDSMNRINHTLIAKRSNTDLPDLAHQVDGRIE